MAAAVSATYQALVESTVAGLPSCAKDQGGYCMQEVPSGKGTIVYDSFSTCSGSFINLPGINLLPTWLLAGESRWWCCMGRVQLAGWPQEAWAAASRGAATRGAQNECTWLSHCTHPTSHGSTVLLADCDPGLILCAPPSPVLLACSPQSCGGCFSCGSSLAWP